jgi:two-component system sensor histidine kinase PilS (NtrC family)
MIEVISLEEKLKDPARIMLIMKDVTDQKKFEEIKRKAQRWSTVAEVSAGMAHEIRNPLASISGSIEVLRDQLSLSDSQSRLMNIVIRESDRLNKLISDFLNLARPRMPEFELVPIKPVLTEMLVLLKSDDSYKDTVQFESRIEPEDLAVEMDGDQFTQMAWNLTKNALDAMPRGGTMRVIASIAQKVEPSHTILDHNLRPPFFRLEVSDDGIGMEQDIVDRIFDPFTTFKRRGVGIGLAIVYRIVENHKGSIRVLSKARKGTTFFIELPLKQPELDSSGQNGELKA